MKQWRMAVVLLLAALVLLGCFGVSDLMTLLAAPAAAPGAGDAARGEQLFVAGVGDAPPCVACHLTVEDGAGLSLGPNLAGISERAAGRVPGMSAAQYLEASILAPEDYIAGGFRVSMYDDYAADLNAQDVADLVAYLLTL